MKIQFIFCVYILSFGFCQSQESPLFSLLPPKETGIKFENTLDDDKDHNILMYANYYGGAGVGVGDFNKDGLPDLYFAGNLVPDRLYLNKGDFTFEDITEEAGIEDNGGWSSGVVVADVNGDGWDDIYVTRELYDDKPELRRNVLYINQGARGVKFVNEAAAYGIDDSARTRHAGFFDYDKDGDLDLYCLNQPPNPGSYSPYSGTNLKDPKYSPKLYRNEGPGVPFTDKTRAAGLLTWGFGNSLSLSDVNGDGWPDIYVANDFDAPDRLYLNNKNGTFFNVIESAMRHFSFYSMGVDAADINRDGMLDIMTLDMVAEDNFRIKSNMSGMNPKSFWKVVNEGGHYQYMFNALHLNQGVDPNTNSLIFSDISQLAGVPSTDWSWSNLIADFDNDGWQDIHVTNGLLRDIRNTDADKEVSKYIGKTIQDYVVGHPDVGDISVWDIIDLKKVTQILPSVPLPNYAYKNQGDLTFTKVSTEWGLDQKSFSNGSAYADLDNDGDLDLVVNNINAPAFIYRNNSKNNWIRFALDSPKPILGATATISYDGQTQFQALTNVRGMYATSEQVFHFGLGQLISEIHIIVTWPDGKESEGIFQPNQEITFFYEKDAKSKAAEPEIPKHNWFDKTTEEMELTFSHQENEYDDYKKEVLLPHKQSQLGPGLATGDVNGDGKEDVFIGGANGQSGQLFLQEKNGQFVVSKSQPWATHKDFEDMSAEFFDADGDGDLDLFVASGGNEYEVGSDKYRDRLYVNSGVSPGEGMFQFSENALPKNTESSSRVKSFDYDGDGDLDLFVGGRQVPGAYPKPASSFIYRNDTPKGGALPKFTDVSNEIAPDLKEIGMVTDAVWADINGDGKVDLVVSGEWMPITILVQENGIFVNKTEKMGTASHTGWWYSVAAADIDGDGDMDLLAGNLGKNYKYQTSPEAPFSVHYEDFDQNGSPDIVLSYYNYGENYPLRGRSCSSQQIPDIAEKFPTYNEFAGATLTEVYGLENLNKALNYKATTFASGWFENQNGKFNFHSFPNEAQLSSVNDIVVEDIDGDGKPDVILAGNLFTSEIETPRNDASVGLWLRWNKNEVENRNNSENENEDQEFIVVTPDESGLYLPYDVKDLAILRGLSVNFLLVATNDGPLRAFRINPK